MWLWTWQFSLPCASCSTAGAEASTWLGAMESLYPACLSSCRCFQKPDICLKKWYFGVIQNKGMKALYITLFKHQACVYRWSPWVPCQHSAAAPLALIDVGAQAATCKLLLLQWTAASWASPSRAGQLFKGIIPSSVSCVFTLNTEYFVPACEPQVQGTTEVPQCHIVALSSTAWILQALFIQNNCAVDSQPSACKPRQQRGPSYCRLALSMRWKTHVNTSALLTFKSVCWSQYARGGETVTQRLVAVLAAWPWEADPLPSLAPVLAEHCVLLLLFLLPLRLATPLSIHCCNKWVVEHFSVFLFLFLFSCKFRVN